MKTCKLCQIEKPDSEFYAHKSCKGGLNSRCKSCCQKKNNEWKEKNPERYRKAIADWRKRNPEKLKAKTARRAEYFKQYAETHKDEVKERSRKHYLANKAKSLQKDREWRKNNPGKAKEIYKRWRENNPQSVLLNNQSRRAMRRLVCDSLKKEELNGLLEKQNFLCANPKCMADLRVKKNILITKNHCH